MKDSRQGRHFAFPAGWPIRDFPKEDRRKSHEQAVELGRRLREEHERAILNKIFEEVDAAP